MTRADIEEMLKNLAETTKYLEETTRLARAASVQITGITARLHLHGGEAGEALTQVDKMLQVEIEMLRAASRKPAERTHRELTEAVARLERIVLELLDRAKRNGDL